MTITIKISLAKLYADHHTNSRHKLVINWLSIAANRGWLLLPNIEVMDKDDPFELIYIDCEGQRLIISNPSVDVFDRVEDAIDTLLKMAEHPNLILPEICELQLTRGHIIAGFRSTAFSHRGYKSIHGTLLITFDPSMFILNHATMEYIRMPRMRHQLVKQPDDICGKSSSREYFKIVEEIPTVNVTFIVDGSKFNARVFHDDVAAMKISAAEKISSMGDSSIIIVDSDIPTSILDFFRILPRETAR